MIILNNMDILKSNGLYSFLFVVMLIICVPCAAQDTIVLMNGKSIEAKIEKITDDEVEYRMWNYQDGPLRVKETSDIKIIKYRNGVSESFNAEQLENKDEFDSLPVMGETYKRQLVVTSGSYKVLREKEFAVIGYDFSSTSWEGDMSFKKWSGEDYDTRVKIAKQQFFNSFNTNSKGLLLKKTEEGCKYKLLLKIDWLGQYYDGWGRFYMVCCGYVEINDIQTGENLCTIRISYVAGETDFVVNERVSKCFDSLAWYLTKLKSNTSFP